jgi:hypothetical protein
MKAEVCGICPDYVIRNEISKGKLAALKTAFPLPHYKLIAIRIARKPLGKNATLFIEQLTGWCKKSP